jgi:aldose 1-epimerase
MRNKFAPLVPLILLAAFIIYNKISDDNPIKGTKKNQEIMKEDLKEYTLTNEHGNQVKITNYGAKVMSIIVPDRNGKKGNVVLGYDSAEEYLDGNPYFGAIIGRYANRIDNGKFTLDGKTYKLAQNNGNNHLHGGPGGFHNVLWQARKFTNYNSEALELTYISEDGEEGYPGTLSVKIIYTWTDDNELKINYSAITDKKTIVNLTHHSFFNLQDGGKSKITDHELMINANYFTPINETLIPTGDFREVEGTPMDFTQMHAIGKYINSPYQQLEFGKGYDHNYVLAQSDSSLNLAARVYEPSTGRVMKVYTDEPGLQFYSGNFLDGSDTGRDGVSYQYRSAFCLEAQHYPDSPNHENFPSTVLEPGDTYKQTTIYKFYVKDN